MKQTLTVYQLQYVNLAENSSKFYHLSLENDASLTIRYGRINTVGRNINKNFNSQLEAERECQKIVRQKMNKGYKLLSSSEALALDRTQADKPSREYFEDFTSMI